MGDGKKITVTTSLSAMASKSISLFSDATLTQGAWVNHYGTSRNFSLPTSFQNDMFYAEFYAAYRAIMDNGQEYMHIQLHCDHRGVCLMLNNRAAAHPWRYQHVNALLLELLSWLKSNNILLTVYWIPSNSNPADGPSRSALMQ